jgi:hypothetical protein
MTPGPGPRIWTHFTFHEQPLALLWVAKHAHDMPSFRIAPSYRLITGPREHDQGSITGEALGRDTRFVCEASAIECLWIRLFGYARTACSGPFDNRDKQKRRRLIYEDAPPQGHENGIHKYQIPSIDPNTPDLLRLLASFRASVRPSLVFSSHLAPMATSWRGETAVHPGTASGQIAATFARPHVDGYQ